MRAIAYSVHSIHSVVVICVRSQNSRFDSCLGIAIGWCCSNSNDDFICASAEAAFDVERDKGITSVIDYEVEFRSEGQTCRSD